MIRSLYLVLVLAFIPSHLISEEHPLANIKGTNIDLKVYDHTVAGSVRDFVIFGYKKIGEFGSKLTMRRDGQIVEADFGKDGDVIGGTIRHMKDSKPVSTTVKFIKLDQEQDAFLMEINGQEVWIEITADSFLENHFINPTYTAIIDGKSVASFKMLNGKACYGFSLQLVFVIYGAYFHGFI